MTTPVLLLAISLLQVEPSAAAPAKVDAPVSAAPVPAGAEASKAPAAPSDAPKPDAAPAVAAPTPSAAPAAATATPSAETQPAPDVPTGEPAQAPQLAMPPAAVAPPAASTPAPAAAEPVVGGAPVLPETAPLPAPAAAFAAAEAAPVGGCPADEACDCAKKRDRLPLLGISFGVGVPEFATANLIVRPLDWLRVGAGITYNYVGYGARGEVTLAPLRWYVSPTLNVAYGRYFKMDATKAGKVPTEIQGIAADVDYQYLDATLGLELGNQRHGMLVVQVGVGRLWLDAPGTAVFDGTAGGGSTTATTTVELGGLRVSGYIPVGGVSWIIFL